MPSEGDPSPPDPQESASRDWAVVVGIDRYPALGGLEGPENDARAFRDWLVAPSGGGVPADHVRLILSSDFPAPEGVSSARPTTEILRAAFDALLDEAERHGMRAGRRLYIYLAGHGLEPQIEQPALLAANASRIRAGNHVAGRLYADWFRRAGLFEEVLLFMDCCREPASNVPLQPVHYASLIASDAPETGKWMTGLATKWSRKSREKKVGSETRGVFTQTLIAGLEGAAAREDGAITDESLAGYLYAHMAARLSPEELRDPDVPKAPDVDYDRDPANRIFITRVPPRPPVDTGRSSVALEVHTADPTAEIVVLDGSFAVAARGAGELRVELPAGIYEVTARSASGLAEETVKLRSGAGPVIVRFEPGPIPSPAPLAEGAWTQPHQAAAATARSAAPAEVLGNGSEIFIHASELTRPGDREKGLDMASLSLVSAAGEVKARLSEVGAGGHGSDAWHACRLEVDPGIYQLRMEVSGETLCRTIVASRGFQTRVFLLVASDLPAGAALGGASIFVARPGEVFDPASPAPRRVELLRAALERGGPPLSVDAVSALVPEPLDDPMLGLLAAHLMLRAGPKSDPRLRAIVRALRDLAGDHPDVEAVARAAGEPPAAASFESPTMLRASWSRAVEASHLDPAFIPAGTPASRAAARLWGGGPWLVWRDGGATRLAGGGRTLEQSFEALRAWGRARALAVPDLSDAELALLDEVLPPDRPRGSRVRPDRAPHMVPHAPAANAIDLARRLDLPPATVHELITRLLDAPGAPGDDPPGEGPSPSPTGDTNSPGGNTSPPGGNTNPPGGNTSSPTGDTRSPREGGAPSPPHKPNPWIRVIGGLLGIGGLIAAVLLLRPPEIEGDRSPARSSAPREDDRQDAGRPEIPHVQVTSNVIPHRPPPSASTPRSAPPGSPTTSTPDASAPSTPSAGGGAGPSSIPPAPSDAGTGSAPPSLPGGLPTFTIIPRPPPSPTVSPQ